MNQERQDRLIQAMILYDAGMAKQIQHFLKVYELAGLIGRMEKIPALEREILETAAITHDIGIREALVKYGNSDGKHQEELGPEEAGKMLKSLGYEEEIIGRVLYLIGHHHTYSNIEGKDYRILVEADFLVNLYEDNESPEAVKKAYERIFRTESGRKICKTMFTI